MKKFVCKERLKTGILLICAEFIFSASITLAILLISKCKLVTTSILVGLVSFILFLIPTLLEIKQYLGKIEIENNTIHLYLLNKKYSFNIEKVCIMYITFEMSPRFSRKELYSIKIRVKGDKSPIPIKIMDEDVIKELLRILDVKRIPRDFKFEWENKLCSH